MLGRANDSLATANRQSGRATFACLSEPILCDKALQGVFDAVHIEFCQTCQVSGPLLRAPFAIAGRARNRGRNKFVL